MPNEKVLQWLNSDSRLSALSDAMNMTSCEQVEGDIMEFGVGCGQSLGVMGLIQRGLSTFWADDPIVTGRRIVGFDSFQGLPHAVDKHPRWNQGQFERNYSGNHPFLKVDEPIHPNAILDIFTACGWPPPLLEVGFFQDTLAAVIPQKYDKVAVAHIDSDLYESAKCILESIEPILQDGTVILFDEWFCYKGCPNRGEARALIEFLIAHPRWRAVPYQTYNVLSRSFILHDMESNCVDRGPAELCDWLALGGRRSRARLRRKQRRKN